MLLMLAAGSNEPDRQRLAHALPWMWLGGLMGLIVVFSITFAQPRIGASATIGILDRRPAS